MVEQELHQVLRQVLHQEPQALADDDDPNDLEQVAWQAQVQAGQAQVQAGPADEQELLDAS